MRIELNIYIFLKDKTKTRSVADPRNVRPIKPKAFATSDLPCERNPAVVTRSTQKRPEPMNKPDENLNVALRFEQNK